jgi:hypothetical protein
MMKKSVLAVAVMGSSLLAAASMAQAAGKGSSAPQAAIHGNAPSGPGASAPVTGQDSGASSGLPLAPTIQPGVGSDDLNLRRTIIRLPFK